MRKVAGNDLGGTLGPLTGPWGITTYMIKVVILGVILAI